MSVKDVKEYYYHMQAQYLEMSETLKDYEEEVRKGNFTEAQLQYITDDVNRLKENYDRLSYVMYLLDRRKKKAPSKKSEKILEKLKQLKADQESVMEENKELISKVDSELSELTGKGSI